MLVRHGLGGGEVSWDGWSWRGQRAEVGSVSCSVVFWGRSMSCG